MGPHLKAVVVVTLLGLGSVCHADPPGSVRQARIYYDELEFLKCVQLARATPPDEAHPRDTAALELLAGLCEANLGNLDGAEAHFRLALRLEPSLELPAGISPKIEDRFVRARSQATVAEAADAKALPISLPHAPVLAPPAPTVDVAVTLPSASPVRARSHVVLVGLGAGSVVAAGVGLYFGATAASLARQANAARWDLDNLVLGGQARQNALFANGFFVAAALLAAGAVIAFVFDLP